MKDKATSPSAASSSPEASGGEPSRMSSSFPPTPSRWKRRSVSILRAGSKVPDQVEEAGAPSESRSR